MYTPFFSMRGKWILYLTSFLALAPRLASPHQHAGIDDYLGMQTCAGCHKEIADTQSHTSMARTWRGANPVGLPLEFHDEKTEGGTHYDLRPRRRSLALEDRTPRTFLMRGACRSSRWWPKTGAEFPRAAHQYRRRNSGAFASCGSSIDPRRTPAGPRDPTGVLALARHCVRNRSRARAWPAI